MDKHKELTEVIDLAELDKKSVDVAQQIINEENLDKVKDLTHLFNLNQNKKNVLRILKLNGLLDKVSDQMLERFIHRADEFSNADLLNYMQVVQNAIDKSSKNLNLVDESPAIKLQQNTQVNINVIDNLNKDSRDRIADLVKSILKGADKAENDNLIELVAEDEINKTQGAEDEILQ